MIQIHVLNSNNIVTLESHGKLPIKSSQGYMFYNANELLCAAVGACAGRQIVIYATNNKVDLTTFEFFGVSMDEGKIEIYIQHPSDFDPRELANRLENCEISESITLPIKVVAVENTTSTEELKQHRIKPCCEETNEFTV